MSSSLTFISGMQMPNRFMLAPLTNLQSHDDGTLLTNQVLQQLIRFYGDSMQGMMSQYLEQSIASFLEHQERIREQMQTMMGVANPLTMMNKIADRNMAVWSMFKPMTPEEKPEKSEKE